MSERHKVATVEEFTSGKERIIAEVKGQEISVFHVSGEYYAVANFCPHQSGPLCEGELTGRITASGENNWEWEYDNEKKNIHCPWHGWVFDVTNGKNIDTDRYRTPTYEVEIEDDEIFVIR